jgi:hypothetical protein
MTMREEERRSLYRTIITAYKKHFPATPLPEPHWIAMWTDKYSPSEVIATFEKVARKTPRDKSASDIGKIISATLRDDTKARLVAEVAEEVTCIGAKYKAADCPVCAFTAPKLCAAHR